ncbi:MAG: hypothetical protein ABI193_02785 [Minicystis sp.]
MEIAVWVAGLVTLLFFLPVTLYLVAGSRKNWGMIRDGSTTQAPGTYRATPRAVWVEGSAPIVLRIAAFSSFLLGQMIIPGGFAAIIGFIALVASLAEGRFSLTLLVITLSAPTGLIVAGRLLSAGIALLGRKYVAAERARSAASWEIGHNVVLLAALCVAALVGKHEEQVCCAMIGAVTVLAIAHGLLLRRAVVALAAFDLAERELTHEGEQVAPTYA